jgi:hypothetical protein
MKDWESRLDRLFIQLRGHNVFSVAEIDDIIKNQKEHWGKIWMLVSLKQITINLVTRSYPVKYLDQLSKG